MKTLLEYITFVKGIEYLIIVAFCFGFIAFWLLTHPREKEAVKRVVVPATILLSLGFGALAIVVITPAMPSASETEFYSDSLNTAAAHNQLKVNSSEYLAITYGPATEFHQVMITKTGCKTCHHNSGDEIHACKDCHDAPFNPHNSSKPGLKAAYHQRCMSCHREAFSGPESCSQCHTKAISSLKSVYAPPRPHQLTWETCSRCHKNGIPGGQETKIVYHDSCLKCHAKGIGGAAVIPDDHAGRASNTCQGCHKPAGG